MVLIWKSPEIAVGLLRFLGIAMLGVALGFSEPSGAMPSAFADGPSESSTAMCELRIWTSAGMELAAGSDRNGDNRIREDELAFFALPVGESRVSFDASGRHIYFNWRVPASHRTERAQVTVHCGERVVYEEECPLHSRFGRSDAGCQMTGVLIYSVDATDASDVLTLASVPAASTGIQDGGGTGGGDLVRGPRR